MADMNAEFLGGELAGQHRAPIDEDELTKLGYRSAMQTQPRGDELCTCYVVPIAWTRTEALQAIKDKINSVSPRKPGKRSL